MKSKKILAFVLCLGIVMATGCKTTSTDYDIEALTSGTVTVTEASVADDGTVIPNEDNVKLLGRTYLDSDKVLWCALSGTGTEFVLNGTKAEITVKGDSSASVTNPDGSPRIAIYVDGERVVDDMLATAEEKTYTVAESDTAKESIIKVVKLSESANSTFGITKIKVDGEVKPAVKKDMLIEFIGDSITCGYGVDDEVKENHFSTKTEDCTKTYAYKTAELMNADYSLVSYSGYGIISGYSGDGKKSANQVLSKYYDKVGFTYGNMNGKIISDVAWDFNTRQPDIIVINLGTNDDSYCKSDSEKQEEYAAGYVDFLKQVRAANPDAKIVCTLGIMGGNLYPYIEYAVYNYTEETGDTNVTSMMFASQDMNDGIAADWHPSEKTHGKAADKLVEFLKGLN